MADTLSLLSIIFFVVAGVCLVVSVVLWFVLRIPSVMGDLSGRTARKSIAKLRMANESSGAKGHRSSQVNFRRGKLTSTMPGIHHTEQQPGGSSGNSCLETGLLQENISQELGGETTGLLWEDGSTQPLESPVTGEEKKASGVKMELIEEIVWIHTQEHID